MTDAPPYELPDSVMPRALYRTGPWVTLGSAGLAYDGSQGFG